MSKHKGRPKYRRGPAYKSQRSIPLPNPRRVDGGSGLMTEKPRSGPTDECFDADGKWYAIKEGKLVRITGEPEAKPKYVVLEDDPGHVELRLYWCGHEYIFVQLYWSICKEFISVSYRGRDIAYKEYRRGNIHWRSHKRMEMRTIGGEK